MKAKATRHQTEPHASGVTVKKNISTVEQGLSLAIGALMFLPIFRPKKSTGATTRFAVTALGAGLVGRGVTGHCPLFERIDLNTRSQPTRSGDYERAVLINKSKEEIEAILASGDLPMMSLAPTNLRLSMAPDGKRTRVEAGSFSKDTWSELRKLKAFIEAGEVPTVEGQPTGKRSMIGKALGTIMESAHDNSTHIGPEPLKVKPPHRLPDGTLEVRV